MRIRLDLVRTGCRAGTPPFKPNKPLLHGTLTFKILRPAPRQTLADYLLDIPLSPPRLAALAGRPTLSYASPCQNRKCDNTKNDNLINQSDLRRFGC
jgi:hypothetical protein